MSLNVWLAVLATALRTFDSYTYSGHSLFSPADRQTHRIADIAEVVRC